MNGFGSETSRRTLTRCISEAAETPNSVSTAFRTLNTLPSRNQGICIWNTRICSLISVNKRYEDCTHFRNEQLFDEEVAEIPRPE